MNSDYFKTFFCLFYLKNIKNRTLAGFKLEVIFRQFYKSDTNYHCHLQHFSFEYVIGKNICMKIRAVAAFRIFRTCYLKSLS